MFFSNLAKYRESRVYRVIVRFTTGYSVGSGFFISENKFLTCFHVAFSKELRELRKDTRLTAIQGTDEHSKLLTLFNTEIRGVEVELFDGTRLPAVLEKFNENYDIALFEIQLNGAKVNTCAIDLKSFLNREDYVFFGGFPMHHDYAPDKTPFAVHEGIISSFVETTVGGDKYEHLQVNSINLGGNSGAPLFKRGGKKVIGIVNGNMNWGNNNIMMKNLTTNQIEPKPFRVPLSIAYATSLKLIKEKTDILND